MQILQLDIINGAKIYINLKQYNNNINNACVMYVMTNIYLQYQNLYIHLEIWRNVTFPNYPVKHIIKKNSIMMHSANSFVEKGIKACSKKYQVRVYSGEFLKNLYLFCISKISHATNGTEYKQQLPECCHNLHFFYVLYRNWQDLL